MIHTIIQSQFGLERTFLKTIQIRSPCYGQAHFPLDQVSQNPILPGLEYLQGWGVHCFSEQPVPEPHHPHKKELLPAIQPDIGYHSTAGFNTKALNYCSPKFLGLSKPYSQSGALVMSEKHGLNMIPDFLQALAGITLGFSRWFCKCYSISSPLSSIKTHNKSIFREMIHFLLAFSKNSAWSWQEKC